MIFANLIRPSNRKIALFYDILCVFAGSLFMALLSQIAIPLWFTPTPLTLQTLGIFLIGAFLGSKKGVAALLTYYAEGILGLPVFAGGSFGVAKFLGPTGGYLLGFVIAVFVIGFLFERLKEARFQDILGVFSIGAIIILAMGASWLSLFVGYPNAVKMGITPFLFGDLLKVTLAASLTYTFRKLSPE